MSPYPDDTVRALGLDLRPTPEPRRRPTMLTPADLRIGRVYWIRGTPRDLRADTETPYVLVGVEDAPRDVVIRYRRCDGDPRTFELYWYTFRRIARRQALKPAAL